MSESPNQTSDAFPVLAEIGAVGYRTEIWTGSHRLLADEPGDEGGSDAGPSPYELLLAALGSCTAMTLRMYADRKGWPLESVTVKLMHERVHARDCADCETEEGHITRITRKLEIAGELDDAQRKRLHEIADRCPVHQTLSREIRIVAK